jgi:hypothetical protein
MSEHIESPRSSIAFSTRIGTILLPMTSRWQKTSMIFRRCGLSGVGQAEVQNGVREGATMGMTGNHQRRGETHMPYPKQKPKRIALIVSGGKSVGR